MQVFFPQKRKENYLNNCKQDYIKKVAFFLFTSVQNIFKCGCTICD